MKKLVKYIFHPITLLILAQISWVLLMIVWVHWYVVSNQKFDEFIKKIGSFEKNQGQWIILLEGCLLMAFILAALYIIFVSQRKQLALTKMQDSIVSSVTHELKTPLASIRLCIETLMVRKVMDPSDQEKFLKGALNECTRLQKLIDTVLLSARLDNDPLKGGHAPFELVSLKEITSHSIQKYKEFYGDKISFVFTADSNQAFHICGDKQDLTILLDNLINNAAKFSKKKGQVSIDLSEDMISLILSVKDEGIGIEKKYLKKIFKKFVRIERNSKFKVEGSGLGLSLCQSIVKKHHGKIYALSDGIDKGSTFYVSFKKHTNPNC
jgi:signal transduction histidine kinase